MCIPNISISVSYISWRSVSPFKRDPRISMMLPWPSSRACRGTGSLSSELTQVGPTVPDPPVFAPGFQFDLPWGLLQPHGRGGQARAWAQVPGSGGTEWAADQGSQRKRKAEKRCCHASTSPVAASGRGPPTLGSRCHNCMLYFGWFCRKTGSLLSCWPRENRSQDENLTFTKFGVLYVYRD